MKSCDFTGPLFAIYKGSNEKASQFYFDGVLNAEGILFMCRPTEIMLARTSDSPFDGVDPGGIVAVFDRDDIGIKERDSDRGRRRLILRLWDAYAPPALPLPCLDSIPSLMNSATLIDAVRIGDYERTEIELLAGADPDSFCDDSNSALLRAVADGRTEIITLLSTYGADPFKANSKGMSAMSLAESRMPKFVPLLRKAEKQSMVWSWIRDTYATAEPW